MVTPTPTAKPEPDERALTALIAQRDPGDLDNALAVLRERVEHEFRRTERLDNKSRQAFALAAGFFAVTQAGAFASFGEGSIASGERVAILVAAVTALIALVLTAARLYQAEELREESNVPPLSIFDWCHRLGEKGQITAHLILAHRVVALERVESNRTRADQTEAVTAAARLALALCGAELILALAVRM